MYRSQNKNRNRNRLSFIASVHPTGSRAVPINSVSVLSNQSAVPTPPPPPPGHWWSIFIHYQSRGPRISLPPGIRRSRDFHLTALPAALSLPFNDNFDGKDEDQELSLQKEAYTLGDLFYGTEEIRQQPNLNQF